MNRILRKITNEMMNTDIDFFYREIGNYKVIRDSKNEYCIKHYYYGNLICYVDLNEDFLKLHNCGYEKYPLTTAQLNFLEKYYISKGYTLIYRGY